MIETIGITKKFGKFYALNEVTISCRAGQCIALIGPNGSGKTTFIKCILGMVVPDHGSINFDNKAIANSWLYRNRIGYMPQIGRYPENMTIQQVFNMMKDIRKPTGEHDEDLVKSFGLDKLMNKRMRTLSGGTTQKVSACLAFLFNSEVLILDEPTAGLDPVSSELLKEKIIKERDKGKLILVTSHVLSELDDLITEVIFMEEGNLKFHSTLDKLKESTGENKLSKAIAKVMIAGKL
jgi:Cu-processing system ATP-binding protein